MKTQLSEWKEATSSNMMSQPQKAMKTSVFGNSDDAAVPKAVLSWVPSPSIAKHTSFKFLFGGWLIMLEEVASFHFRDLCFH